MLICPFLYKVPPTLKPGFCSWLQNPPEGPKFCLKGQNSGLTLTKMRSILRQPEANFATAKFGLKAVVSREWPAHFSLNDGYARFSTTACLVIWRAEKSFICLLLNNKHERSYQLYGVYAGSFLYKGTGK
jgi:hypothetical protein